MLFRHELLFWLLDILEQVISHMKASRLQVSVQYDETTNIFNCNQLIALVRCVHYGTTKKNFLFCEEMKTTSSRITVNWTIVNCQPDTCDNCQLGQLWIRTIFQPTQLLLAHVLIPTQSPKQKMCSLQADHSDVLPEKLWFVLAVLRSRLRLWSQYSNFRLWLKHLKDLHNSLAPQIRVVKPETQISDSGSTI